MTPQRKSALKRALHPMPVRERISHRGLLEKFRVRAVVPRDDGKVKH